MKSCAWVAVLGLLGLLAACGGDSGGGGPLGSADPIVGTWRVDGEHLKAEMTKMLGDVPAEERAMAQGMMDTMMKSMIEKMRFVARADGTYTGTGPSDSSAPGAPEFEDKKGKWVKKDGGYEMTEDGKPDDKVHIQYEDGHLEFRPEGSPFALRLVRA